MKHLLPYFKLTVCFFTIPYSASFDSKRKQYTRKRVNDFVEKKSVCV